MKEKMKELRGMAEFYPEITTSDNMLSAPHIWKTRYSDFNSRVDSGGDLALVDREGLDDEKEVKGPDMDTLGMSLP